MRALILIFLLRLALLAALLGVLAFAVLMIGGLVVDLPQVPRR